MYQVPALVEEGIVAGGGSVLVDIQTELKETLKVIPHKDDTDVKKDKRKWVQTLVFPLKKTEKFNGKIENLKVEFI